MAERKAYVRFMKMGFDFSGYYASSFVELQRRVEGLKTQNEKHKHLTKLENDWIRNYSNARVGRRVRPRTNGDGFVTAEIDGKIKSVAKVSWRTAFVYFGIFFVLTLSIIAISIGAGVWVQYLYQEAEGSIKDARHVTRDVNIATGVLVTTEPAVPAGHTAVNWNLKRNETKVVTWYRIKNADGKRGAITRI
jgi:hypothetical protein